MTWLPLLALLPLLSLWVSRFVRAFMIESRRDHITQISSAGPGSVTIQSGGNISISASNGSVAALQIGEVHFGRHHQNEWVEAERPAAPPPPRVQPARTLPLRAFTATTDCPTCGDVAVHRWRDPEVDDLSPGIINALDLVQTIVVRQCGSCGQEWCEQ